MKADSRRQQGGRDRPAPDRAPGRGQPRTYRSSAEADGVQSGFSSSFVVREQQTDLWIACRPGLDGPRAASACLRRVREVRADIIKYAAVRQDFLGAMSPLPLDAHAPPVVRAMLAAGLRAGVGPMATVAGAIAEDTARYMIQAFRCAAVVVENGGDIFAFSPAPLDVAVMAGNSPLSGKLTIRVRAGADGISVCTSSGTVGPSLSLGRADAATAIAASGAFADALATALGNRVSRPEDIEPALQWLAGIEGALGGLAVYGEHLGLWGQVEVVPRAASD